MKLRQEISSSTINIAIVNIAEKGHLNKSAGVHPDTPLDPPLINCKNKHLNGCGKTFHV